MLLEQLASLTADSLPAKPALEAALAKVKLVVSDVDRKKFEHEQKLALAAVYARLQGEDAEELLQPHRHLLREGAMVEIAHHARDGRHSEHDSLRTSEGPLGRHLLARHRRPTKHVILCNDSLWYCELLRGNRYRLLHVFHFAAVGVVATQQTTIRPAHGSPPTAFWLSDDATSVLLQPGRTHTGADDGDAWVMAVGGALEKAVEAQATSVRFTSTVDDGGAAAAAPLEDYLSNYRKRFDVKEAQDGANDLANSAHGEEASSDEVTVVRLSQVSADM